MEVLPHLYLEALRAAEPTWVVGYSDLTTVLLPLTTACGWATLHGQNLMDTPYAVPEPLAPWLDPVTLAPGERVLQGASRQHRASGHDVWEDDPTCAQRTWDSSGPWRLLDPPGGPLHGSGRLVGGGIETISTMAGTAYGDVRGWAAEHAPEGAIVHCRLRIFSALTIARDLWRLRLAGWFEAARAVLVGRTTAPGDEGFTQEDAVRSALGDRGMSVVLDVDCGHVPPHLALVGGALAELLVDGDVQELHQRLI